MLKFKKMGSDKVPLLLVTANVGSIFEEPSTMLPIWTSEFLQAVSRMDPKFIALHLQEVGGKTYEKSMQYVKDFVQRLCDCPELRLFDKIRIFLDEDYSSPEKFTALGNMYFSHSSLTDLKMWDFELGAYVNVEGTEIHSGNIEKVSTKEKCKFPQNFFPECKWSRKGFLRTRWFIRGTAVEFVNIHLFHDASNLVALEPFPSVYCKSRRRALRHVLRHLHADPGAAPYFIFGDFNFRTDTGGVVKRVTAELAAARQQGAADTRLQYSEAGGGGRVVLTVGKKEFAHAHHQTVFREPWLQRYDRELDALRPHLFEFPLRFPPSYPFEEDVARPTHYMKTRCPAWCDRVLLSQTARLLIQQDGGRAENRHLNASRKSVCDSTDSSAGGSADSSPARSASPARHAQPSPSKNADKRPHPDLGLAVPGLHVSRKSIADPTSVQQALNSREVDASTARRRLVRNQSEGSPKPDCERRDPPRRRHDYGVIGDGVCMGDHKPIYLRVMLQSDRGTTRCCDSVLPCFYCMNAVRLPAAHSLAPKMARLPTDPHLLRHTDRLTDKSRTTSLNKLSIPNVEITDYSSYEVLFVNEINEALLNPKQRFEPYTPESIDSHTPNAETVSSGNEVSEAKVDTEYVKLSRDRSVSPTQLKSRLDMLLNDKKVPELERLDSRESCMSGKSRSGKESLCCLAVKCYRFWRRSKLCNMCRCGASDCRAP